MYTETNTLLYLKTKATIRLTSEKKPDKRERQRQNETKKTEKKRNEKNNQSLLLYYIIIVLYLNFNSMRHMMKLIKLIDFLYNFDNKSCVLLATLPTIISCHFSGTD